MAQVLDVATKQVVEVPDEQVTDLVASGKAVLPRGEVHVLDADGKPGTTDAREAQRLFAQGYRYRPQAEVEAEEREAKYGDRPLAAGAAGLARGVTLGLSDAALAASGAVEADTLRGLEDANPEASISGEVVGTALPAFFTAGAATPAGLAARAARGVGAHVAEATAAKAAVRLGVEGAVEGGLQGLGRAITDAAQQRDPLTAQKALASTAEGALFGLGGGVLFGGAEDVLASRGARKAAAADVPEALGAEGAAATEGLGEDASALPSASGGRSGGREVLDGPLQSAGNPPQPRKAGTYDVPLSELDDLPSTPNGKKGAADRIREGYAQGKTAADFGPLKVGTDAGDESNLKRTLVDGNHRLAVARERGEATVPVTFTDDEAAGRFVNRPRADGSYADATAPMDAPLQAADNPSSSGGPGAPAGRGGGMAEDVAAMAQRLATPVKQAIEANPGVFKRVADALDLHFPDANEWVLRALDIKKKGVTLLEHKDLLESAPRALREDARFAKVKNGKQLAELVATKMEEEGATVRSRAEHLDKLVQPQDALDVDAFAQRARDELVTPLSRGTVDQRATARRVEEELKALVDNADYHTAPDATESVGTARHLTFAQGEDFKRALDPSLKWDSTVPNAHRDALRQLRGMLNAAQEEVAQKASQRVGSEAFEAWKKAKQEFGKMAELNAIAEERIGAAKTANRFFSLTDNLAGTAAGAAAGGLNPLGLATGLGAALLNKWGRENLPLAMALAIADYEDNPSVRRAASAFASRLKGAPPVPQGPIESAVLQMATNAARQGPREAWLAHAALSGAVEYRALLAREGVAHYTPASDAEGDSRSRGLSPVDDAAARYDARADAAVRGLLSGGKPTSAGMAPPQALTHAERLSSAMQAPDALVAALGTRLQAVGAHAPGLALDMQDAAQRAHAFLAAKAPPRPAQPLGGIPALRRPWRPSDMQLARFGAYVRAVQSPAGVLEDAAAGRLTGEALEALGAVYPDLLEDMRARVLSALAGHQKPLDYRRRLALGQLLGMPLDESMQPATMAAIQASLHQQPEPPAHRTQPSNPRTDKRLASEFSTTDSLAQRTT